MTIWSLVSRIEFLILSRDEKFSFMIDDTCFRILFKIVRGNRELQLDYYVKRLTIHVRNKDFRKSEDSRRESFRFNSRVRGNGTYSLAFRDRWRAEISKMHTDAYRYPTSSASDFTRRKTRFDTSFEHGARTCRWLHVWDHPRPAIPLFHFVDIISRVRWLAGGTGKLESERSTNF